MHLRCFGTWDVFNDPRIGLEFCMEMSSTGARLTAAATAPKTSISFRGGIVDVGSRDGVRVLFPGKSDSGCLKARGKFRRRLVFRQ